MLQKKNTLKETTKINLINYTWWMLLPPVTTPLSYKSFFSLYKLNPNNYIFFSKSPENPLISGYKYD